MSTKLSERFIETRGMRLHVMEAGPENGPLVILLHGFPEFWYSWRKQIPALSAAGYRVVAPDQRGYNTSSKPAWLAGYRIETLANDIVSVIDHYEREQAAVVGHDWGAMVAWTVALQHPERVYRLGILNVPHPTVATRTLTKDPEQLLRSSYAGFFQLPWLPEVLLGAFGGRGAAWMMRASSRAGIFTQEDLKRYQRAWAQPGALTSMLNWYRAYARFPLRPSKPHVRPPTLILWGKQDVALKWQMAKESLALCEQGDLIFYEASHWVQHEKAEEINQELDRFLK